MSGSIRLAKAHYRGDPGLFGDIGKFIGGAVKGTVGGLLTGNPLAAIGGGIMGGVNAVKKPSVAVNVATAGNGKPVNPSILKLAGTLPILGGMNGAPQIPQIPVQVDSTRTSGVSLFPGGPMVGTQTTYTSPAAPAGKAACGAGYHPNKTGYFTRAGYVAPGTRCVKNRRRNPLNPRAASRAMGRLKSAKKAAHFLNKFWFGSRPQKGGAPSLNGRKKGCGCK